MKHKYYVVLRGHQLGIYTSREACKQQVEKYAGAVYKSFLDKESAEFAWKQQSFWSANWGWYKWQSSTDYLRQVLGEEFDRVVCTDAACPSNPGPVEYRAVSLREGKELFRVGPLEWGSVNLAEFLAIVEAMVIIFCHFEWSEAKLRNLLSTNNKSFLDKLGMTTPPIIYSDSKIAINRVRNWSFSTTVDRNRQNRQLFDRLDMAINWLVQHPHRSYSVELRQRPTKLWGQIPADFGRK